MCGGGVAERQCRNRGTSSGGASSPRHSHQSPERQGVRRVRGAYFNRRDLLLAAFAMPTITMPAYALGLIDLGESGQCREVSQLECNTADPARRRARALPSRTPYARQGGSECGHAFQKQAILVRCRGVGRCSIGHLHGEAIAMAIARRWRSDCGPDLLVSQKARARSSRTPRAPS